MSETASSHSISYLLASICKAHRNWAEQELSAMGLHVGQEMLLGCLWQKDGLGQTELAAQLSVQPATVCKMLSRMEAVGLVTSRRDEQDSRLSRVFLTSEGKALQPDVAEVWARLDQRLLAGLAPEQIPTLGQLLQQLRTNLDSRVVEST